MICVSSSVTMAIIFLFSLNLGYRFPKPYYLAANVYPEPPMLTIGDYVATYALQYPNRPCNMQFRERFLGDRGLGFKVSVKLINCNLPTRR